MRQFPRVSLLLLLSIFLPGCGKGYQVAPVSGRVLLDDRPFANAEVRFVPTEGKDLPPAVGFTDDQGNYTLHLDNSSATPGAVIGEQRVEISLDLRRKRPGMDKPTQMPKNPREMLSGKSNRTWTLSSTVPPGGKSDANFELKSK